jgi:hypothetical protein
VFRGNRKCRLGVFLCESFLPAELMEDCRKEEGMRQPVGFG